MKTDYAFEMAVSGIRFGWGVTREVVHDLVELGARRVMIVTDPLVAKLHPVQAVLEVLHGRVEYAVYDRVRVEPTDESFLDASKFASEGGFDAFLAAGGGSSIDTAKAANLYSTHPPEDFLDYVNPPLGRGLPPPGPLKPLIAIPTTAGTGSETTGVAIFDYTKLHAKTGVAHRRLKPILGILDPENTRTMPPQVAAATGLDVLSHAIESFTAIPYDTRPLPERPVLRPAYQGSNPVSDVWSLEALRIVAEYLPRAVADPEDREARARMLLAASYAGIGFGNAGVHLPHGMSYPVSGMVRDYRPAGYNVDHPLVPHGVSVILNAPAVSRYTAQACPERHLKAAAALGVNVAGVRDEDAGKVLADRITSFMQRLNVPNGLKALGYTSGDIPALVEGTMPQHRVTKLAPRQPDREELARLFEESMTAW
jgi:hydroxyacid-oxoacid transhydrogenase